MKAVCISDMHGKLSWLEGKFDVLFICGDIVPLYMQRNFRQSVEWLKKDFVEWYEKADVKHIFIIAGNHDFVFEKFMQDNNGKLPPDRYVAGELGWDLSKVTYLRDSLYEYDGIRVYGTPWCPALWNWAFYLPPQGLKERFDSIPENIDVLLTHSPGKHVFNTGVSLGSYGKPEYGSCELAEAVRVKKPKYWFCGHVHTGNHEISEMNTGTKVANVSLMNESYEEAFRPLHIEI